MGAVIFVTSKFEMPENKNKYIKHHYKLVFGHFYVVTSFYINNSILPKIKIVKQRIYVTSKIF